MQIDYPILQRALPGLVTLLLVEAIDLYRDGKEKNVANNLLSGMALNTGALIMNFLGNSIVLLLFTWLYQFRIFYFNANGVLAWAICFLGDDLSYYWYHRCSHQIRFLWASHQVHHSSESYTLAGGIRVPWTSYLSGTFLFWAWMPLIGISPAMVLFMKSTSAIYQFWLHTEKINRLPAWFEFIFNTPSHHRVHHASNPEYLDKNHAGTLIIWDRLFGSFRDESANDIQIRYGLTENIGSYNPVMIAFHGWKALFSDLRKTKSTGEKLNHVFNAPGWSADGHSKTTKQIQAELENKSDH